MHPESFLQPAQGVLIAALRGLFGLPLLRVQAVGNGQAIDIALGVDAFHNTGGPRSRTRRETITASLFPGAGRSGCLLGARRVGEVWAIFHAKESLRAAVLKVLSEQGFATPEEAFAQLDGIPRTRLHCRRLPGDDASEAASCAQEDPLGYLRTALVLGKCCHGIYDPERPVILTDNRLRQRLELYEIRGSFYDDSQ
jgi:hypothetical protein